MENQQIKKILLKPIKAKRKKIDIPTEQELINIIINIFILRLLKLKYINSNTATHKLYDYIKSIKALLLYKIKYNNYDFNINELITYIENATIKINTKNKINGNIDYKNITKNNLIKNPYIIYNKIIKDITKQSFNNFVECKKIIDNISNYYLVKNALNIPINKLSKKDKELLLYENIKELINKKPAAILQK